MIYLVLELQSEVSLSQGVPCTPKPSSGNFGCASSSLRLPNTTQTPAQILSPEISLDPQFQWPLEFVNSLIFMLS